MIHATKRQLTVGVRFYILVVLASMASCLTPPAVAQTCNPVIARWTTTVPVDSPPTLYSIPLGYRPLPGDYFWFTTMLTDQPWATVTAFSNDAVTIRLDVSGLPPGLSCIVILDGNVSITRKNPTNGTPCGANFDPKVGWFNLKTTVPWSGPCELKVAPDAYGGPGYGALGIVAVYVVTDTYVSIVDPVPDLVSGNAVKSDGQLQVLPGKGRAVSGVAADGVTQVVIRIQTPAANHQFTVKLLSDQQLQSSSAIEDGALGNPGDTSFSQSLVTVSSGNVGSNGEAYAFAVYRAPLDFARPAGAGFKSGACNGTPKMDDQLACRSISIQVQDITAGTSPITVPVTIVRPPVVLVHGLWADWREAWKSFSPLVRGNDSVDSRFSVQRVSFDNTINPPLTSSTPQYDPKKVNLGMARANSLGVQYNTPRVLKQITDSINAFKNGRNPANQAVAAVQVDIVAHSVGGILIRTMPRLPQFFSDAFYKQGFIHKVITIDSPHLGSPLAALLLDPTASCTRELLAGSGNFSFTSVTQQGSSKSVPGAVADIQGNGIAVDSSLSEALSDIAKPGPRRLPTALVAGVYTNFASLDCTVCNVNYIRNTCKSRADVLASRFTSTAWPLIFGPAGSNENDALVGRTSQLNGLGASSGFVFTGYAHSPGVSQLNFSGPTVLDSLPIVNQVIKLLNTPYTDSAFQLLNP